MFAWQYGEVSIEGKWRWIRSIWIYVYVRCVVQPMFYGLRICYRRTRSRGQAGSESMGKMGSMSNEQLMSRSTPMSRSGAGGRLISASMGAGRIELVGLLELLELLEFCASWRRVNASGCGRRASCATWKTCGRRRRRIGRASRRCGGGGGLSCCTFWRSTCSTRGTGTRRRRWWSWAMVPLYNII